MKGRAGREEAAVQREEVEKGGKDGSKTLEERRELNCDFVI